MVKKSADCSLAGGKAWRTKTGKQTGKETLKEHKTKRNKGGEVDRGGAQRVRKSAHHWRGPQAKEDLFIISTKKAL